MFQNRIVKNSAWIIGIKIIQAFITLIVGMLTARYLGPSNFGLINYAASIVAFVVPIMNMGINNILVHYLVLNEYEEGEIIGSSIGISCISSLLCVIGITVFTTIVNGNEKDTVIVCFLYSLSLIFQSIEIIQYWFQAKLLSKYISISTLIAYTLVAAYKIYLLVSQKSVAWFALSYAIDYMLISSMLFILYKKLGGQKPKFSIKLAKDMLSKSKYYIVSSMMVAVFAQTDRIMLKLMINDSAVGYYSAACAVAGMTSFVFAAIIDSFRPIILAKKEESAKVFKRYMTILFGIVIYLSLGQSIAISILSKIIVNLLYGSSYQNTIPALRIVVWYTTFSYLGSVRNIWILAEEKYQYLWILNLSGALGNVVLNLILIPYMGIEGAALASLVTQFFTNVVMNQIIKSIRPVNLLIFRGLFSIKHLITNTKNYLRG